MTTNQTVKLSRPRDVVMLLTLDRPERVNTAAFDLFDDLQEAFEDLQQDPRCPVMVLTGEGKGSCSEIYLHVLGDPQRPEEPRPHVATDVPWRMFRPGLARRPDRVLCRGWTH